MQVENFLLKLSIQNKKVKRSRKSHSKASRSSHADSADAISDQMFDDTILYITNSRRESTKKSFHENNYYNNMPVKLRQRLVSVALNKLISKFKYFFNNYEDGVYASKNFVTTFASNLDAVTYAHDDTIIEAGSRVHEFILIYKGAIVLNFRHPVKELRDTFIPLIQFPSGSYFGDFQIMVRPEAVCDWRV